jgi:probable 2-oxoglutarate dehydrogenase E1 component DHKTD1
MNEGLVAEDQVRTHATQVQNQLEQGLAESRAYTPRQDFLCGSKWSGFRLPDAHIPSPDTGVPRETLLEVGLASVRVDGLAVHPRLEKLHIAVRAQKLQDDEPLDWATAEALAIGSLLLEGYNVRLSGQVRSPLAFARTRDTDAGRGARHVLAPARGPD